MLLTLLLWMELSVAVGEVNFVFKSLSLKVNSKLFCNKTKKMSEISLHEYEVC